MHRLLLIDDDEALAAPLKQYLARFDFDLAAVNRPSEALKRLAAERFDALILDGMLPEMDGFEFCRRLRAGTEPWREMPVLMLTARGDLTDRVVGLELGADDYLAKPFEPRELAARLQTILRRTRLAPSAPPGGLAFDGLEIDPVRREVRAAGGLVELTSTEYELLLLLAREPGRVFTRDEILNSLRGQEAELFTRAVDILVSRIRRKAGAAGRGEDLAQCRLLLCPAGKDGMRHHDLSPEEIQVLRKLHQRRRKLHWQHRWHRHHAHFKHSLGARLIATFVLLALPGQPDRLWRRECQLWRAVGGATAATGARCRLRQHPPDDLAAARAVAGGAALRAGPISIIACRSSIATRSAT